MQQLPLQLDPILQTFRIQYYSAINLPTEQFEQMLNSCNEIIRTKDIIISQLKSENLQLASKNQSLQSELTKPKQTPSKE